MARVATLFCLLLVSSLQHQAKGDDIGVLPHLREYIEGITYEALEVFQSYPVDRRNTDQTWKIFATCEGLSGHREISHTDTSITRRRVSKPCNSVLRNCRFDESMNDNVSFCVSGDKHRRYDYMEINKNQKHVYGRNLSGKCPSSQFENYSSAGLWYPCVCDCESSKRVADRYFSLIDVVSDEDKVVTGIRFRKVDHVFHIQIQQARLGWNKLFRGNPVWKNVESLSMFPLLSSSVSEYYEQDGYDENWLKFHKNDLVYAVTSEQNTVLLDDLVGGPNEVLTGLRFRQVGQDLRLEIQVTPFDNVTALLDRSRSKWLYNDIEKNNRSEVKLRSLDVSGRNDGMEIMSSNNQFIKFQVSDFKADLGQTTVPFIAITDVNLNGHQILSGAGIFYRGSTESAGVIALKGITREPYDTIIY